MGRRRWSIWVLAAAMFASFTAGTDDYVRLTMQAPAASPYRMIRYEVTKRTPATTAVHRRLLPGYEESLHTLGLLTASESGSVDALLASTDAMRLPDAATEAPRGNQLTWQVELMVDGKRHSFTVVAPSSLRDRRYAKLIDGVRRMVHQVAGPLPFRNVFFSPRQRGWINIVSVPVARVFVDGFDTQMQTPLYAYELKAGVHTIRLESTDGRYKRTYQTKVEPQGTTNLKVDLR